MVSNKEIESLDYKKAQRKVIGSVVSWEIPVFRTIKGGLLGKMTRAEPEEVGRLRIYVGDLDVVITLLDKYGDWIKKNYVQIESEINPRQQKMSSVFPRTPIRFTLRTKLARD